MAGSRPTRLPASDPKRKFGGSKCCLAEMAKRGQTKVNELPDVPFFHLICDCVHAHPEGGIFPR